MSQRVKMIATTLASEDGIHAKHYMAGKVYNVSEDLLMQFVEMGVIEIIDDQLDGEFDPIIAPENRADSTERRGRGRGRK